MRHAWCTYSLSVEAPSSTVSRSWKFEKFLLNSAISVGQTKVKSLGHQNSTAHLPLMSSLLIILNSFPFSIATTAFLLNSGNLLPTVTKLLIVLIDLRFLISTTNVALITEANKDCPIVFAYEKI